METLSFLAGLALIAFALVDIFREVVHPNDSGAVSSAWGALTWNLLRPISGRALSSAGPLTIVASIVTWVFLLVAGWACLIWPALPEGYSYGTGIPQQPAFLDALYLSQVTLFTLGYGDIVPSAGYLRLVMPLEAFVGFGVLSAATSWILSLYPPLSRLHFAAHELAVTRRASTEARIGLSELHPRALSRMLERMTAGLVAVHSDFTQFPLLYRFRFLSNRSSLPAQLPWAYRAVQEILSQNVDADVRLQAERFRRVLADFAETLAPRLGVQTEPATVFEAYAREHLAREATAH